MGDPNLFNQQSPDVPETPREGAPLAHRMRPSTLEEFAGQEEILASGSALRRAIEADRLPSMIFFGPPGTGKTSLAMIIAAKTKANFRQVSAVSSGVADLRKVFAEAEDELKYRGRPTILFVDEIHRFSKAQQDALLPVVESGVVTLIGATTENPYFEVIGPLLSRCELYEFHHLEPPELRRLVKSALEDGKRGLGKAGLALDDQGFEAIARASGGDARAALIILETAAELAPESHKGIIPMEVIEEAVHRKPVFYQKGGDLHYDAISAFIKSMRGSDPDAAIYWLAVMLTGGEDPKFIARRMVIFASEDIGNADPQALVVATSVSRAVEFVGLPECQINMSQGVAYLCLAPKSNASYRAIGAAMKDVKEEGTRRPPKHLRDSHYPGAKKLEHGTDYQYPHNFSGAVVEQDYLPPGMEKREYYSPSDRGFEKELRRRIKELKGGGGGSS
ncbi:MAG: replication-associated recombination protein A [Actinobacteria bacterium]|nr:replication-associated recombination protein A [Actinomycetota bacterium]